jgi:hypothetical protein
MKMQLSGIVIAYSFQSQHILAGHLAYADSISYDINNPNYKEVIAEVRQMYY